MPEICLYTRSDGLLEPRSTRAWEYFKKQKPGSMFIGNFTGDRRSALQNRYLNGWVYKQAAWLLNEAGYTLGGHPFTRDRLHAVMQEAYLVIDEFELNGEIKKVYESTATMSRERFVKYIDLEVKPFVLMQWEISIPDPRDDFFAELHREIYR